MRDHKKKLESQARYREKNREKIRAKSRLYVPSEKARKNKQEYWKSEHYKNLARNGRLMREYGITQAQYEEMLAGQGGGCAICGKESSGGQPLSVDHCHSTGKVRGILCSECNVALGLLHDDKSRILKLIEYLGDK